MKFNDPDVQSKLLDLYAMYKLDTKVAEMSGVSRTVLWRMEGWSEEGKEGLQEVEWGGVIKAFHLHKLDALDMQITDVQQRVTRDAAEGYYVDEVQGGVYHYIDDEYACGLTEKQFQIELAYDDEMRELLGVPRVWEDKKLRVYNPRSQIWERQRVQRYVQPTLDAQSKVLAAFAPELFGDKRSIDLNMRGNVGLGVTVIGQREPLPVHVLEQIAPTPPLIDADAEYDEIEPTQPEQEPMNEQTPFVPDPASPLSADQQAILERLKSPNPSVRKLAEQAQAALNRPAKPAQPVRPAPPQPSRSGLLPGGDQDDTVQRRPVGYKVC